MEIIKQIYKLSQKPHKILEKRIGNQLIKRLENKPFRYALYQDKDRNTKIVVSCASYSLRYSGLGLCLKSMMYQTLKPDKIIVWLDEKTDANKLTREMEILQNTYGIEFVYTDGSLGSHKKYFYAMQEYMNDFIITIDDDLVYPSKLIESLYKTHLKYPQAVCARRVHKITIKDGRIEPYNKWLYEYRYLKEPSHLLCATGGAGTLYPPGILPPTAFDTDKIKSLSYKADDIWLKYMEVLNNKKVVWAKNILVMPPEIHGSQKEALNYSNTWQNGNDKCINELNAEYPDVLKTLINESKNMSH